MKNKRIILVLIFVFIQTQIFLLSSCAKAPDVKVQDGILIADTTVTPSTESDNDSDMNAGPQGDAQNVQDVFQYNLNIIKTCSGMEYNEIFTSNDGRTISLNASVNTSDISTVGLYNYVLEPITEDLRNNLFLSYFGERASSVEYDSENNVWTLSNTETIGDYYLYNTYLPMAGETIPEEESFSLTYRKVDLYPFNDNLLESVDDSLVNIPLADVLAMCTTTINDLVLDDYEVDYVLAYGTNGRHPYYKVTYKKQLDNIPVTAYNDIYFLVDSRGIQKICGSIFSVEKQQNEKIISVDTAISYLSSNISQIYFEENHLSISQITLEYIVVKTISGEPIIVPAWRFLLGETNDQTALYGSHLLAINAISGEIIQGERGNTF